VFTCKKVHKAFYESLAVRCSGAVLVYGPGRDVAFKSATYSTACALLPVSSAFFAEIILDVFDSDWRNCGTAHWGLGSFGTCCRLRVYHSVFRSLRVRRTFDLI
jgi:hypothetical protein